MNAKPQPNHKLSVTALRRMTPEQRLQTAFELGDLSRALLKNGLRTRFPDASEEQLQALYLKRLETCHNRRF